MDGLVDKQNCLSLIDVIYSCSHKFLLKICVSKKDTQHILLKQITHEVCHNLFLILLLYMCKKFSI